MNIDKRYFKRMFPYLAQELESGENKISIDSVRSDIESGEKTASSRFNGYNPDVIDFLRRCDTKEQADKIIEYLVQKKEISQHYADKLKKQLQEKGVRSFGSKKKDGYYLRQAGY
ncbi:hypothetical protein B6U79_00280 [Candidatus Bathyarchaeota archaeon ex4484_231]|nr:MAG: hypothetical protein B6U79_00280 [Candidatus Bathyarchaeota archaeon ex4484_231]